MGKKGTNNGNQLDDAMRVLDRCEFGDCWRWQGSRSSRGYGTIRIANRTLAVHRVVWEALVGSIPDDLEIDHLCRVKECVNPDHMEPVTHQVNCQRGIVGKIGSKVRGAQQRAKTHCPEGHPYSGDNLYVDPKGRRECRICRRAADLRYKRQKGNQRAPIQK